MKLVRYSLVLILVLCVKMAGAQQLQNLAHYVDSVGLVDFGYGLQDSSGIDTTFFNLNIFLDKDIQFKELTAEDAVFNFPENDTTVSYNYNHCTVKLLLHAGQLRQTKLYRNNQLLARYQGPNEGDGQIFSHFYFIEYKGAHYCVVYCQQMSMGNSTLQIINGLLIDVDAGKIMPLPYAQSTPSLLCFTNYDGSGLLGYVSFRARWGKTVKFYHLKNNQFLLDHKCQLSLKTESMLSVVDSAQSVWPKRYKQ